MLHVTIDSDDNKLEDYTSFVPSDNLMVWSLLKLQTRVVLGAHLAKLLLMKFFGRRPIGQQVRSAEVTQYNPIEIHTIQTCTLP
jgi:hypothetical protein